MKLLKTILTIVLAVAIVAGIVVVVIYLNNELNPSEQGNSGTNSYAVAAISDEGEKLYAGGTYAMPKAMTIIADAPKSGEYSPSGEFIITASVSNEYINGIFDFTYDFMRSSDDWANDKEASDYISVIPVSANQAKVTLLAAFGAPIEIKAQLIGSDSFATCRVDYLQRLINSSKIEINGNDFTDGADIAASFNYGIGTVKGDWELTGAYITLDWDFIESFESYLKFNPIIGALGLSSLDITNTETEDNLVTFTFGYWEYSMFIKDFKSYSEQQKNAVYYAWYAAYKDFTSSSRFRSNILIDVDFEYTYKGVYISIYSESDMPGGQLSGIGYGEDISPDVDLNGDVTF